MYSYGAPRTGSPAFTKVNLEGSSAVLISKHEIEDEEYFNIYQCDNEYILFPKCPHFRYIQLILYYIILLFNVLFCTYFRNSMSSWTMLSV